TLIFDFVPRTHSVAISGTVTGGLIRTGIEVAKDVLDWVAYPILDPSSPQAIDELTGRDGEVFPVYRNGEWSPVDEISQTVHIGRPPRLTAGGKSPEFISDVVVGGIDAIVRGIAGLFRLDFLVPAFMTERAERVAVALLSRLRVPASAAVGRGRVMESSPGSPSAGFVLSTGPAMPAPASAHGGFASPAAPVANGDPSLVGQLVKVGRSVGVEMPD